MRFIEDRGRFLYPFDMIVVSSVPSANNFGLDAANKTIALIGEAVLSTGAGTSKTISAAGGGAVVWKTNQNFTTFSNAGTTLRIGVCDVNSAGEPDGTFDVYADLTGGTDTIANNTVYETVMESGSKTITHGDLIALTGTMLSVGGTDIVRFGWYYNTWPDPTPALPFITKNSGAGFAKEINPGPVMWLKFDDGTYGSMAKMYPISNLTSVNYMVNTATRDEYGNLFTVPFWCLCEGISVRLANGSSNTFEMCLYEDPLNSPVLLEAKAYSSDQLGNGQATLLFNSAHILSPSKTYAITIRPTNTSNVGMTYFDGFNTAMMKFFGMDSESCYAVARVDNSGAFSDFNGGTAKTRRMQLSLWLSKIGVGLGQSGFNLGV